MLFSTVFTTATALLALTSATPLHRPDQDTLPFSFTPLFSGTINLAIDPAQTPITIPGGVLINEPVVGGTIGGPAINASISGGFAHPSVVSRGTVQVPIIDIYGVTEDGQSFTIRETGTGSPTAQVTRIELAINGTKYADLNTAYILASVNPSANRTVVSVRGYAVRNIV